MGTIADKLNKVLETKAEIEAALEEKGVDIPDKMVFADYAEKIKMIHTPMIVIYRGD